MIRRALLRLAWRLSRLGVFRRGRAPLAAAIAVLWEGRILVVRHSYRPGQSLPGGGVRRSVESPEECARRELAEETGIDVALGDLRSVYADLSLRIFEVRTSERPEVRPDRTEVVAAEFLDVDAITEPDAALANYLLCRIP